MNVQGGRENESLLVFGDDGSPAADVAWLWICNHPWPGWRAELVTAIPPSGSTRWGEPAEVVEWESPYGRRRVAETQLSSIRTLRVEQDPRLALDSRSDADLAVVAPHHRPSKRGLLLGSTTEWIIHHPSAPTAVIRSAAPTRDVLVCVDGSVHAQAALEAFVRLPLAGSCHVTLLAVDDKRTTPDRVLEQAEHTLADARVDTSTQIASGKPADAIFDYLDEHGPQLVVLGTRGLTGLKRLRLGSTAGSVIRASTCSTLVACADQREPAQQQQQQ